MLRNLYEEQKCLAQLSADAFNSTYRYKRCTYSSFILLLSQHAVFGLRITS